MDTGQEHDDLFDFGEKASVETGFTGNYPSGWYPKALKKEFNLLIQDWQGSVTPFQKLVPLVKLISFLLSSLFLNGLFGVLSGIVLGAVYATIRSVFLFAEGYANVLQEEGQTLVQDWRQSVTPFQKLISLGKSISYLLSSTLHYLLTQSLTTLFLLLSTIVTTAIEGWRSGIPGVLSAAGPMAPETRIHHPSAPVPFIFDGEAFPIGRNAIFMIATIAALAFGMTATVLFASGGFSVLGYTASLFGTHLSILAPLGAWMPAMVGTLTFLSTAVVGFMAALAAQAGLYLGSVLLRSLGVLSSLLNPLNKSAKVSDILTSVKKDFNKEKYTTSITSRDFHLKMFTKKILGNRESAWEFLYFKLPVMLLTLPFTLTWKTLYWLPETALVLRLSMKAVKNRFVDLFTGGSQRKALPGLKPLRNFFAEVIHMFFELAYSILSLAILPLETLFFHFTDSSESTNFSQALTAPWRDLNPTEKISETHWVLKMEKNKPGRLNLLLNILEERRSPTVESPPGGMGNLFTALDKAEKPRKKYETKLIFPDAFYIGPKDILVLGLLLALITGTTFAVLATHGGFSLLGLAASYTQTSWLIPSLSAGFSTFVYASLLGFIGTLIGAAAAYTFIAIMNGVGRTITALKSDNKPAAFSEIWKDIKDYFKNAWARTAQALNDIESFCLANTDEGRIYKDEEMLDQECSVHMASLRPINKKLESLPIDYYLLPRSERIALKPEAARAKNLSNSYKKLNYEGRRARLGEIKCYLEGLAKRVDNSMNSLGALTEKLKHADTNVNNIKLKLLDFMRFRLAIIDKFELNENDKRLKPYLEKEDEMISAFHTILDGKKPAQPFDELYRAAEKIKSDLVDQLNSKRLEPLVLRTNDLLQRCEKARKTSERFRGKAHLVGPSAFSFDRTALLYETLDEIDQMRQFLTQETHSYNLVLETADKIQEEVEYAETLSRLMSDELAAREKQLKTASEAEKAVIDKAAKLFERLLQIRQSIDNADEMLKQKAKEFNVDFLHLVDFVYASFPCDDEPIGDFNSLYQSVEKIVVAVEKEHEEEKNRDTMLDDLLDDFDFDFDELDTAFDPVLQSPKDAEGEKQTLTNTQPNMNLTQ